MGRSNAPNSTKDRHFSMGRHNFSHFLPFFIKNIPLKGLLFIRRGAMHPLANIDGCKCTHYCTLYGVTTAIYWYRCFCHFDYFTDKFSRVVKLAQKVLYGLNTIFPRAKCFMGSDRGPPRVPKNLWYQGAVLQGTNKNWTHFLKNLPLFRPFFWQFWEFWQSLFSFIAQKPTYFSLDMSKILEIACENWLKGVTCNFFREGFIFFVRTL